MQRYRLWIDDLSRSISLGSCRVQETRLLQVKNLHLRIGIQCADDSLVLLTLAFGEVVTTLTMPLFFCLNGIFLV